VGGITEGVAMPGSRPFRFGVWGPRLGAPGTEGKKASTLFAERARQAEAEGYAWIVVSDHVIHASAPLTTMMYMAAVTSTLRVSTMVMDNNVRHPILLAKETAMIDVLSDGRFELGIGAASLPFEHSAYLGIATDPVGVRVRRLEEALHVIKAMWGPEPFSYRGEFYGNELLDGIPKPIQQPRPPIRLGGFGKRLLSLAGREADIVNIVDRWPSQDPNRQGQTDQHGPMSVPTEADLHERVDWIRAAAGDRFDDIELELFMWGCVVSDEPEEAARGLVPQLGSTVEEVLGAPDVAIGNAHAVAEHLEYLREKFGISSFLGVPAPAVGLLAGT
jgi:probable F420-dependent oxidoreductase